MSMFDYEIEEVISTHSFDRYQMSVVTCIDEAKNLLNGIAIYPIPVTMDNVNERAHIEASGLMGKPLVIDKHQATRICNYIGTKSPKSQILLYEILKNLKFL